VIEGVFAVSAAERCVPAAVFTCAHCAEGWRREHLPHGTVIPLQLDIELFGKLVNESADVVVVQNANYASTAGALDKQESIR
jgi:hypothetical protein